MEDSNSKSTGCLPRQLVLMFVMLRLIPSGFYCCIKAIILCLIPRRCKHHKDISGQTVLITGAGNGIGRLLAIKLSKLSVNLVLMDLDGPGLKHTEELLDPSSKSFLYECDISNRLKVYETAEHIKKNVGKVDILVNNAGVAHGHTLLDLPDAKIQKIMEVNTMAHFWMLKAFLPDMKATNKGHIVCMASMAGLSGLPRLSAYCASKFAVVGLMESLIWELESEKLSGIKITTVCPNLIATGLFAGSKRAVSAILTPEEVANEIFLGLLEDKRLVMIPGYLHLFMIVKLLMPHSLTRKFFKQTGLLSFMDEFKGRSSFVRKEPYVSVELSPAETNNDGSYVNTTVIDIHTGQELEEKSPRKL